MTDRWIPAATRSDGPPLTMSHILELDALREQLERAATVAFIFRSRIEQERAQLDLPMAISRAEAAVLGRWLRIHAISTRLRCRTFGAITLGHLASHEEGLYG